MTPLPLLSLKFTLAGSLAVVLAGASSRATDVTLNGTGYIYLERDPAAPAFAPDNTNPDNGLNKKRFFWSANKAALRFGINTINTSGQSWHDYNIGEYSFAGGLNAVAKGPQTFAFGKSAQAHQSNAIAMGEYAYAYFENSVAIGYGARVGGDFGARNTAIGSAGVVDASDSIAIGLQAEVNGAYGSMALGPNAYAQGGYAVALGYQASAGDHALALGGSAWGYGSAALAGATANGSYSIAAGQYAQANGEYAMAFGATTTAQAPFSFVVGRYNVNKQKDGVTQPAQYVSGISATDPVFEIGTGTGNTTRSNALTVFRDGTARFGGPVEITGATGKVVLSSSGVTGTRQLTVPNTDGDLLVSTSSLDASKLINTIPTTSLPSEVTQAGATVNLDTSEVEGNLPWDRVAGKPATLAGYLPADNQGRITSAIRILPQGDIPMFAP